MNKKISTLIIFLSIFILGGFILIYFEISKIKKVVNEISVLREKKFDLERKEEQYFNLKKIFDENKEKLGKIDALLIDMENPLPFIEFLEKESKIAASDVKISLSQVSQTTSTLSSFIFSITLKDTTFLQFLSFLNKMEHAPYLIKVENFGISKGEKEKMNAEITLKAFGK